MAVKIRRSYKGASTSAVLGSSVTSATQTSISLSTSPSDWPTGKFFIVAAPGTAQEEKMCVTLSGSTLTVVSPTTASTSASSAGRGVDNTTARSTIASGSTVYPVFTAIDADEANELTSTYANQGGIVYQGASTFTQLGIGTAGQVLSVNSGATAPEWVNISTAMIADSAVTSAKIADGTIALADLATAVVNKLLPSGTISPYVGSSSPTGWLICDGSTVTGGQTTYPDLWAVLPATYKSGSDIVLPNLKGRTVVGLDSGQTEFDTIGETGGAKTHTLSTAEMPSHSHVVSGESIKALNANDSLVQVLDAAGIGTSHTENTSSTGGGGAHNNLQPYITFNYIIKT